MKKKKGCIILFRASNETRWSKSIDARNWNHPSIIIAVKLGLMKGKKGRKQAGSYLFSSNLYYVLWFNLVLRAI